MAHMKLRSVSVKADKSKSRQVAVCMCVFLSEISANVVVVRYV